MTPPLPSARYSAVQEVFGLWALSFAAILIAFQISPTVAKLVATAGFLYLPLLALRGRGEDFADYGLTLRGWRRDVALYLKVCAVTLPLFTAGFMLWIELLPHLPRAVAQTLSPLGGTLNFQPRLPHRFPEWVVDQLFVVALPEEFFYRGFIQTRLRDAWPRGRTVFGVQLGPAFWVTAALFAIGHLAIFQVWRLSVFFPALVFAWARERTGTIVAASLIHATFNLFELVLEASLLGRG